MPGKTAIDPVILQNDFVKVVNKFSQQLFFPLVICFGPRSKQTNECPSPKTVLCKVRLKLIELKNVIMCRVFETRKLNILETIADVILKHSLDMNYPPKIVLHRLFLSVVEKLYTNYTATIVIGIKICNFISRN